MDANKQLSILVESNLPHFIVWPARFYRPISHNKICEIIRLSEIFNVIMTSDDLLASDQTLIRWVYVVWIPDKPLWINTTEFSLVWCHTDIPVTARALFGS